MDIYNVVEKLIEKKCEGAYWDYKEAHCENKADLIHDIVCMANNLCDRDAYIIYGVEDENAEIKGVEKDAFRRNQQEIINQLKDKKFAGGIKPFVELKTIILNNHELDILTIKNSSNTPFYLSESFSDGKRTVRANFIYTRINDTNTDIDKTADVNHVEYLWRKRFGIDKSVMERLHLILDDTDKWIYKSDLPYYHRIFPEFHIEYDTDTTLQNDLSHERFCGFYLDHKASYYGYKIYYHSTILFDSIFLYLDGVRVIASDPKPRWFTYSNREFRYYYFEKDSIYGKMLRLFRNGSYDNASCFGEPEPFLIFENEDDRKNFEAYVKLHLNIYDSIILDAQAIRAIEYEKKQEWDIKFCESMSRLYQMFIKWKMVHLI